jgi:hypothetical protein
MADLTQANVPASAQLAAVARYAETISAPASELNTVAAAFAERMGTLDSGVRAALGLIEMTPPDERGEGAEEFLEQLMSLDEAAQEGLAQIGSFGASAGGLLRVSRPPQAGEGDLCRGEATDLRHNEDGGVGGQGPCAGARHHRMTLLCRTRTSSEARVLCRYAYCLHTNGRFRLIDLWVIRP